ncbi:MAG: ABC transporter permease [Lachnospiraceae bacterium]|nr:ABC transporter permease [Lachnospiraceae bacterium]
MGELVYCEFLKLKRTKIKVIAFLGMCVPPVLSMFSSIRSYISNSEYRISLFTLYDNAFMFLMLLFGPLIFSVIAAYLFSREYTGKTLKMIMIIPISKKRFMSCKFLTLLICIITLMLAFWAVILILCTICNIFIGAEQFNIGTALFFLFKIIKGGTLLYFTITPIAYLAFRTRGIIVPMIVAAVIALVNVILSNSPFSGIFPWSAVYFISNGRTREMLCPAYISLAIILLMTFISYKYCCKSFEKEDIN